MFVKVTLAVRTAFAPPPHAVTTVRAERPAQGQAGGSKTHGEKPNGQGEKPLGRCATGDPTDGNRCWLAPVSGSQQPVDGAALRGLSQAGTQQVRAGRLRAVSSPWPRPACWQGAHGRACFAGRPTASPVVCRAEAAPGLIDRIVRTADRSPAGKFGGRALAATTSPDIGPAKPSSFLAGRPALPPVRPGGSGTFLPSPSRLRCCHLLFALCCGQGVMAVIGHSRPTMADGVHLGLPPLRGPPALAPFRSVGRSAHQSRAGIQAEAAR